MCCPRAAEVMEPRREPFWSHHSELGFPPDGRWRQHLPAAGREGGGAVAPACMHCTTRCAPGRCTAAAAKCALPAKAAQTPLFALRARQARLVYRCVPM